MSALPQRYRIGRKLGRGGMAEVFEAQAIAEGGVARRVAVKRLLPGQEADAPTARMFLDEARIASQLHHGSIVSLFDYGVHEGKPFQVLELVDGLDAASLRKLGERAAAPLPVEVALHLVSEVALALDYAHHAASDAGEPLGVVHRDVKPANILVSWNGDVKLGDFGIALAREAASDGKAKGTPAYMAPEQLRGERVDGRADVFSLGCALHALVTGESALRVHGSADEVEIDAGLDPELAAVVQRATHTAPEERYPTAGTMADDVGALLARRLDRAPRSALLAWLARVRPAARERASERGKLDGLLHFEMALSPTAGEAREFLTLPSTTHEDLAPPPSPSRGAAPPAPQAPPRRPARGAVLALALVAAALGAWKALSHRAPAPTVAIASTPATAPPAPPSAAPEVSASASPSLAPETSASLAPTASARPKAPTAHQPSAARPVPSAPPAPLESSGMPTTGMLVIRGPGSVGAEIRVDGASRGLAPKMIELPTGTHSVVLVLASGQSLGPRSMVVTARNTRSMPVAWDVAAR